MTPSPHPWYPRRVNSDRLRYFAAIAATGSLRRAAEILHLSPAALSKAVRTLEGEVGTRLLAPSGRGIVLTEAGSRLAAGAQRILQELEDLRQVTTGPLREVGEAKVASFEVFTTHALTPLLEAFPEGWNVRLYELGPGRLEEAVAQGQVDWGITYIPIPRPEVEFTVVAQVEMGIFARPGVFTAPWNELPFVVPVTPIEGSPTRIQGLDGWPDFELPRRIRYRVTLMESALELCRRGKAVGYFPRFVVERQNQVSQLPLQELPLPRALGPAHRKHAVSLVHRKGNEDTPTARKLAKALRQLCTRPKAG